MTRSEARMIAEELMKLLYEEVKHSVSTIAAKQTDRQMSVSEAASYLGCAVKTIYNKLDVIPHYKVGRHLRFSEAALTDYIRERSWA